VVATAFGKRFAAAGGSIKAGTPRQEFLSPKKGGLNHAWTAFRIRSESEIQPSAISALRSEAASVHLFQYLKQAKKHFQSGPFTY
jgi:hypothetical protein